MMNFFKSSLLSESRFFDALNDAEKLIDFIEQCKQLKPKLLVDIINKHTRNGLAPLYKINTGLRTTMKAEPIYRCLCLLLQEGADPNIPNIKNGNPENYIIDASVRHQQCSDYGSCLRLYTLYGANLEDSTLREDEKTKDTVQFVEKKNAVHQLNLQAQAALLDKIYNLEAIKCFFPVRGAMDSRIS